MEHDEKWILLEEWHRFSKLFSRRTIQFFLNDNILKKLLQLLMWLLLNVNIFNIPRYKYSIEATR